MLLLNKKVNICFLGYIRFDSIELIVELDIPNKIHKVF